MLVVCTLDSYNPQSANLALDMPALGADWGDTLVFLRLVPQPIEHFEAGVRHIYAALLRQAFDFLKPALELGVRLVQRDG